MRTGFFIYPATTAGFVVSDMSFGDRYPPVLFAGTLAECIEFLRRSLDGHHDRPRDSSRLTPDP